MRIGINCLGLDPEYTGGVSSYTFGLLQGFGEVGSKHHFIIVANQNNKHLFTRFEAYKNFEITPRA